MKKLLQKKVLAGITLTVMGAFLFPGGAQAVSQTYDNQTENSDVILDQATSGTLTDNTLTIKNNSTLTGGIYAAQVNGSGSANKNTITVENSTIKPDGAKAFIVGYVQNDGSADENTLIVTNSNASNKTYGLNAGLLLGDNTSNTANSNKIIITKSTITSWISSGYTRMGTANGNKLSISDNSKVNGYVQAVEIFYGGTANENTTNITDSTITGAVYGVKMDGVNVHITPDAYFGTAAKNTVNITNTTVNGFVNAANVNVKGSATNNTVNITNSIVSGNVSGANVRFGIATNNTVNISGGTIEGGIYGGTVDYSDTNEGPTNNTVNISNSPTLSENTNLYGGYIVSSADGKTTRDIGIKTGNTLNVSNSKGMTINNLGGFATINVEVPQSAVSGDSIFTLKTKDDTDIKGTTVTAKVAGDSKLNIGDKIYIINKENGQLLADGATLKAEGGTVVEGVSVSKEVTLTQEDNDLVLTFGGKSTFLDQTKSFVETRAAGAAMVNKAADQFVTSSIVQAVALAGAEEGMVPFATMGGGKSRLATGSHVDLVHRSVNVGLAKMLKSEKSKLTFGPFFEYGWGSYDSYLDSGVHGEGDLHNTGGGLFIRDEKNDGMYLEGSLRAGKVKSDYKSRSIAGAEEVSYNSGSTYYGAHIGLGKIFNYDNADQLDIYGRYMYSRTGSDTAKLSSGETYEFDAVNSNRFMLGGRYTLANGFYSGLAWQYEASGSAQASYKGMNTAAPSLHGHTGILELGWKTDSSKTWELDLGVTGYAGQDRGVGLHLGAAYHF